MYLEKIALGALYEKRHNMEDALDRASFDEANGRPEDAEFWKDRVRKYYQTMVEMKKKITEQRMPAYGFFIVAEFWDVDEWDAHIFRRRIRSSRRDWQDVIEDAGTNKDIVIYAVDKELYDKVTAYLRTVLPWEQKDWLDSFTKED